MRAREADVSDNVILVFGASPGNYAVETVALFPPLSPRRAWDWSRSSTRALGRRPRPFGRKRIILPNELGAPAFPYLASPDARLD
jgi:hypothetical protein